MTFRRIAAVAALLALFSVAAAPAQDQSAARMEAWERDATRAEEVLAAGEAATSALEVLRETLVEQRAGARTMVAEETKRLGPLREQLSALGPPPAEGTSEAPDVAAAREDLRKRIEPGEGRLKKAEVALTRVDGLIKQLDAVIRDRFANALLSHGPSPLAPWRWPGAVAEYVNVAQRIASEAERVYFDPVAERQRESRVPALLVAAVLSVLLIYTTRRWFAHPMLRDVDRSAGRGRRLAVGLMIAGMRLFGPLIILALAMFGLRQSGLIGWTAESLMLPFSYGVAGLIIAFGLGQVMFAPASPELRIAQLSDKDAHQGARVSGLLGIVLFLESLLIHGGTKIDLATSALIVVNLPIVAVGGFLLFRLARLIRPKRPKARDIEEPESAPQEQLNFAVRALRAFSLIMMLAAILSPIVASLGYFAASRYILYPMIMSCGLLAGVFMLFIAFREGVNVYVEERETEAPGLRLLSMLLGFLLACAALPVLALIWGARTADLTEWWGFFAGGFRMGEVRISPLDFLKFALVFTVGYSLTRLVQGVLRMSVLPNTRLDSGARAAIVSGAGYLGFILAALAAIAATGLDLSNIAIVAGALSVGIGFGLQNIVNNFVSGIILLIERPIKAGDWIEVGTSQGYVTKVSVRATEIETFDRATLIVPNSELISTSVLNMTHSGMIGRVRVPVGVAYGTDPRKVEKILFEIVKDHSMVLKSPAPNVLFMGFGADSLDFEIRGFLRDVNYVLSTKSDMNFEIERRFREEGIEIPFAQRDLHIRNVDALGETIRAAMSGRPRATADDDDGEDAPEVAPADATGEKRPEASRNNRRTAPKPDRDDAEGASVDEPLDNSAAKPSDDD